MVYGKKADLRLIIQVWAKVESMPGTWESLSSRGWRSSQCHRRQHKGHMSLDREARRRTGSERAGGSAPHTDSTLLGDRVPETLSHTTHLCAEGQSVHGHIQTQKHWQSRSCTGHFFYDLELSQFVGVVSSFLFITGSPRDQSE